MALYSTRPLRIGGVRYDANQRLPDTIQNVGALVAKGEIKIIAEPVAHVTPIAAVRPALAVVSVPVDPDPPTDGGDVETTVTVVRGGKRGKAFSKD